jgi:hypothetical protein
MNQHALVANLFLKEVIMQMSKLALHSVGVVAANKPTNSNNIEVTPIEDVNMANGELTDNMTSSVVAGADSTGASFEATVNSSITVTAEWLPFGSNRHTSPDVRSGERVAIYKFADADKYYWSSLEYAADLRKLETVIYTFSNIQVESSKSTSETTYFLEISTHKKIIHLHTSKSDGEPFVYDLMLNTRDGNLQFRDDIDNIFCMDSAENKLTLINSMGSFVDIDKNNITINAIDNVTINAGSKITMNAGSGIYGNAPVVTYTTPTFTATQLGTFGSSVSVGGALAVSAGMKTGTGGGGGGSSEIGGSIAITGSLSVNGTGRFTGSVSAPNIK